LSGVPNAKLDYRTGYYGEKEWNALNKSDRERQLQEALLLNDPETDIALAMEIDWFRMNPTKFFVPVSVRIPGSAVTLSKKNSADFDFIGVIRDSKGKTVANVRDEIPSNLPMMLRRSYRSGVSSMTPDSRSHQAFSPSVFWFGRTGPERWAHSKPGSRYPKNPSSTPWFGAASCSR
jgi:hypothetical protein